MYRPLHHPSAVWWLYHVLPFLPWCSGMGTQRSAFIDMIVYQKIYYINKRYQKILDRTEKRGRVHRPREVWAPRTVSPPALQRPGAVEVLARACPRYHARLGQESL
jgi:hypothetical protein